MTELIAKSFRELAENIQATSIYYEGLSLNDPFPHQAQSAIPSCYFSPGIGKKSRAHVSTFQCQPVILYYKCWYEFSWNVGHHSRNLQPH